MHSRKFERRNFKLFFLRQTFFAQILKISRKLWSQPSGKRDGSCCPRMKGHLAKKFIFEKSNLKNRQFRSAKLLISGPSVASFYEKNKTNLIRKVNMICTMLVSLIQINGLLNVTQSNTTGLIIASINHCQ